MVTEVTQLELTLPGHIQTAAEVCPNFEGCAAPICPLDKASLKNALWYPDEPICKRRGLGLKWLTMQRRIAKKAKRPERYFTYADFHGSRVRNPQGHDPDSGLAGKKLVADNERGSGQEGLQ
ncbi:MAG: hypothetical protein HYX84_01375 [Chloroflexi bacterium]|nr:hypothetical protein [Chloroflexota bacterium]